MTIRALALVIALSMAVGVSGQGAPSAAPRLLVRLDAPALGDVLNRLVATGYDVVGVNAAASTIDVVVSASQWDALRARGYRGTVVDRTRPLREALRTTRNADGTVSVADAIGASATFLDLNEVVARLQQLAAMSPGIARVVDITDTYGTPPTSEGRHLFALKISDNVGADEDEPSLLVVSAHHAREITTPLISLGIAERLIAGYGSDARLTAAVDQHEIWIAPVWNPDGYSHVFATDNMWRKSRRVFPTGVGVDQNRNYPQGWSAPCSGSTSTGSGTYKGPSAGSEPETQTMMTWSRAERFAKVIDYHSYGREVLHGYLCLTHPFAAWMQQEAEALSRASGYGGSTRLPSAEGEHPQWQLASFGSYAFLIETHTEFQPSYASALAEANLVWPGALSVLERPIPISGHVTSTATGQPLAATIEIANVVFANGERHGSGGAFGAYHLFVPPGVYELRFSAPGHATATRTVTVTSTSATVLDVRLDGIPPQAPRILRIVGG